MDLRPRPRHTARAGEQRSGLLIAYLDESFTKDFFCFAAVLADEHAIRDLSRELDAVIASACVDFGLSPDAEIHGYPMFHGLHEWAHMGVRSRVWVFERVIDAILATNVTLLLRGTHSSRLIERQDLKAYPVRYTREQVCFQHILQRIEAVALKQNTHALVIADDRDDRDSHRTHFASYKSFGTPGEYMSTRLDRILDTVYFAPSHPSRLLQAADILAFTYRRWNTQQEPDHRSQLVMDRLRDKITSSQKLHSPGNWP